MYTATGAITVLRVLRVNKLAFLSFLLVPAGTVNDISTGSQTLTQ